ncbi:MAG: leucine-rich repeat domain-containing protein [Clostridia bacterium]|nr:leucine-rich repeat domain-containing protein [Clostridia bacterium]
MVATAVVLSAVVFDRFLYKALEMLPMVDAAMLVFLLALRCLCDNEEQSETFSPLDNLSESTVPNDENQTTETTDEEKLSRQRFIEWIMICLWVVSILFIPLRAFATDGINMQNSDYKYNISFAGVSVCKYIGDEDTCEVVVPNRIMGLRVREIDSEAFRGCDKISDISLPEGLRVIRRHAFADCGNLKTISIPDSVTQIEPGCFEDCVSLAYVKLPKQLNGISEGLFTNCKSLKEIDMPDTMEYLRRYAFAGCESLESISIPNGVRSIEYATFAECTGLRTVELSDSVEQIQSIAFIGCPSLREIYIPASVTEIGASAFDATITICDPSVSYAIEYAIEYGYAYVEM